MILLVFLIISGLFIGYFLPIEVGGVVKLYLSLSILIGFSSLLEILNDLLNDKKDVKKWLVEFTSNLLLSTFLVFISLRLTIPLYYAVIIYFGSKIFDIIGKIRYFLLQE